MNGSEQRVLYVEDDDNDVFFLQEAAQKVGLSASLQVARSGPEALGYLEGVLAASEETPRVPALVLLDLKLPGMTGLDVLRWIRGRAELRKVPVIVFSSSGLATDMEAAHECGADGYVVKRCGQNELAAFVQRLKLWLRGDGEMPGGRFEG
jgi:two-component system, response regulator